VSKLSGGLEAVKRAMRLVGDVGFGQMAGAVSGIAMSEKRCNFTRGSRVSLTLRCPFLKPVSPASGGTASPPAPSVITSLVISV